MMKGWLASWTFWALLSAAFAALTAIFAKVGVEGIGSDLATFLRTLVIVAVLGTILAATGQFSAPGSIAPRSYLFLLLSGLATGASWLCYFRALKLGDAARVAPIDKLSVVLVAVDFPGRAAGRGELAGGRLDRRGRHPRRLAAVTII